jgi:hypothetical protein
MHKSAAFYKRNITVANTVFPLFLFSENHSECKYIFHRLWLLFKCYILINSQGSAKPKPLQKWNRGSWKPWGLSFFPMQWPTRRDISPGWLHT